MCRRLRGLSSAALIAPPTRRATTRQGRADWAPKDLPAALLGPAWRRDKAGVPWRGPHPPPVSIIAAGTQTIATGLPSAANRARRSDAAAAELSQMTTYSSPYRRRSAPRSSSSSSGTSSRTSITGSVISAPTFGLAPCISGGRARFHKAHLHLGSDASPGSNQCREDLNAALPDHFITQAVLQGFDVDFFSRYCTNLSQER